jgi:predicted DNA-binding transcriptional regulator YafY
MQQPSPRQFERLLQIDEMVRTGRAKSVAVLARELEVSDRTISSDIDLMRDRFDAPLQNDRKKGWYYEDKNWRLTMVQFTQGELFALVLGSRMLEAAAGGAYAQELQSAIDQLVRRLPDQIWADLQTIVEERIQFGAGALVDLNPEYWKNLIDASRKGFTVEMTYYAASRDITAVRKVDPYFLFIYRGTNPYAIGFCHERQAMRDFRVDRIRALRITEEKFIRKAGFDAREYIQKRFQVESGDTPVPVAIQFSALVAPFIRERRWHPSQAIVEHADGLILRMQVPGLSEVKRWVLGYGAEARVLEPPELVAMVRQEVEQLQSLYAQTHHLGDMLER